MKVHFSSKQKLEEARSKECLSCVLVCVCVQGGKICKSRGETFSVTNKSPAKEHKCGFCFLKCESMKCNI